ncbi:acetyltransferase [Microbacterium sp. VKM Ac-2870]|uniref:acyltransferase family protein n=1 Tax=Microbacterium sp. VKM Ac-2870 TaxID=2783825 RepID=UPI00188BA0CA|nr:acyltransferase family protein [Microbacterium sp. VKM Ac-2870]MBF4561426.1 acetyltransferase [Microbacterium sp. VKM Ac-2870]
MTRPSAPRFAGLDGLRAIAVALVVVYHLFPQSFLRSGFVGVDVFFVISGFLITSLLLREHAATGAVALRSFWVRRARRLLPALAVVVTVSASCAWLLGGDVLLGLGRQVLGAITFSYNWASIATGASYFGSSQPELLRNLWSLALEEQFYVVWPLLLPLFLFVRGRAARAAAAGLVAAASAVWALQIVGTGGGLTRAYYGTDTHAFGLLLGVALAFALANRSAWGADARPSIAGVGPAWSAVIGGASIVGIVVVSVVDGGERAYPAIPLAASALTAVAIAAATMTGSWFGRALDAQPLRWIGERSYGIYLWHWPIVVLLSLAADGTFVDTRVPVPVGAAAALLTLVISAASYRLLEQPIRRLGFRASARALGHRLRSTPARRFGALASLSVAALVLGGTTAAVATAPAVSSSEAVVEAGQRALDAASATPSPSPATSDAAAGSPTPTATEGPDGEPLPPPPVSVSGDRVTAVGDSVMLASAPGLLEQFPGIQVDAEVSRSLWAGKEIIDRMAADGALRDYVVVGLGTNGPVDGEALQDIYDRTGRDRTLVLVTAFAPRDWIDGVNRDLTAFAASHPGVIIADWSRAIAGHTDLLAGDEVHPGESGGRIYADTVAGAVDAVENQHAEVRYQVQLIRWAASHALVPSGAPAPQR